MVCKTVKLTGTGWTSISRPFCRHFESDKPMGQHPTRRNCFCPSSIVALLTQRISSNKCKWQHRHDISHVLRLNLNGPLYRYQFESTCRCFIIQTCTDNPLTWSISVIIKWHIVNKIPFHSRWKSKLGTETVINDVITVRRPLEWIWRCGHSVRLCQNRSSKQF